MWPDPPSRAAQKLGMRFNEEVNQLTFAMKDSTHSDGNFTVTQVLFSSNFWIVENPYSLPF